MKITKKLLDLNYQRALALSGTKPVKLILEPEDPENMSMMWTWEDTEIHIRPIFTAKVYGTHTMMAKREGYEYLTLDKFLQWKFLHETNHINTYKKFGRVYGEDVKTADDWLTGVYVEERNATLYADKFIPNYNLKEHTLANYSKTNADIKDSEKYLDRTLLEELSNILDDLI